MDEKIKDLMEVVKLQIVEFRGEKCLLDATVARIYGVETKHVNQAVKNNPEKFPEGYMFRLNEAEVCDLRSKFSTLNEAEIKKLPQNKASSDDLRSKILTANLELSSKSRAAPAVFTEKDLYTLATILKSKEAIQATFAIIETFSAVRALRQELLALHAKKSPPPSRLQKFGEMLSDIIMPELEAERSESSLELNFIIGKIKHSVKRVKKRSE